MKIDLEGKVAIVTGAGRGIGREIAATLAGEGVTTVVTDVRQEYLDSLADEFARRSWRGQQHRCDVRRDAQGLRLHARTALPSWLGERLDVGWGIDVLHPQATRGVGTG